MDLNLNIPLLMGELLKCGCRIQYLPQGCAVIPCKGHQEAVIAVLREPEIKRTCNEAHPGQDVFHPEGH